jgi:hypothetical protein
VSEKGIQVMDIVALYIPVDTLIIDFYGTELFLKKVPRKTVIKICNI